MKNSFKHFLILLVIYLIITLFIFRDLLFKKEINLENLADISWSFLMIIAYSIEYFYIILIIGSYIIYSKLYFKSNKKTLLSITYILFLLLCFTGLDYYFSKKNINYLNTILSLLIFASIFGFSLTFLMNKIFNKTD